MTDRTKYLIGLAVAGLIVIGLLVWFMATHPAPTAYAPSTEDIAAAPAAPTEAETIQDISTYYEIRARYPKSVSFPLASDSGASTKASTVMKAWTEAEIARFKDDSGLDQLTPEDIHMMRLDEGRKYALTIAYTEYRSPKTVSFDFEVFSDTLGAHPNTYYRTFTFDATTGQTLAIGDLFQPGSDYLGRLSQIARAKLPGMIAEREQVGVADIQMDMLNDGTKPTIESFQNFYIDGANLVLVFSPYQVGPYVLGTVLLPIPLSSLDILKTQYR